MEETIISSGLEINRGTGQDSPVDGVSGANSPDTEILKMHTIKTNEKPDSTFQRKYDKKFFRKVMSMMIDEIFVVTTNQLNIDQEI